MDMLPPQAPPAIVSHQDQVTRDAVDRLDDVRRWLVAQNDLLPLPSCDPVHLTGVLDHLDAFWQALVESHPGHGPLPRQQWFAEKLAQVARDNAHLLARTGLLTPQEYQIALRATRPDTSSTTMAASRLTIDGKPHAGAFVVGDGDAGYLLFTTHGGWEHFASLDGLLDDIESRIDTDGQDVSLHAIPAHPFDTLAQDLVAWYRQDVEAACDDIPSLLRLLDIQAMLGIEQAPPFSGRVKRSPPRPPTGVPGRRLGIGTVAGGRVSSLPPDAMRAGGSPLLGRVPSRHRHASAPVMNAVFPESMFPALAPDMAWAIDEVSASAEILHASPAIADDLVAEQFALLEYELLSTEQRGILQDALGKRLTPRRASTLLREMFRSRQPDAGALLFTRLESVAWRESLSIVHRRAGAEPFPSGHADYLSLDLTQANQLRQAVIERLSHNEGQTVFARMARPTLSPQERVWLTPRQYDAWTEALDIATRRSPSPDAVDLPSPSEAPSATARPIYLPGAEVETRRASILAAMSPAERRTFMASMRRRMTYRYGRSGAVIHRSVAQDYAVNAENRQRWNKQADHVLWQLGMSADGDMPDVLPSVPSGALSMELADIAGEDIGMLRTYIEEHASSIDDAIRVYTRLAQIRPSGSLPEDITASDMQLWNDAKAYVKRNRRNPNLPKGYIPPELRELNAREIRDLRTRIILSRQSHHQGMRIYRGLMKDPEAPGSPNPKARITDEERQMVHRLIADILSRRGSTVE